MILESGQPTLNDLGKVPIGTLDPQEMSVIRLAFNIMQKLVWCWLTFLNHEMVWLTETVIVDDRYSRSR